MQNEQFAELIAELIQIGYEQADSNDEALTDFDDALRIYSGRHPDETIDLAAVAEMRQRFENEF